MLHRCLFLAIILCFAIFPVQAEVMCTMDAKMCPDGTGVGRTGPNCEFAPCPGEKPGEKKAPEKKAEVFKDFWTGFKAAVLAGDREKVADMTAFPFKDGYRDIYDAPHSFSSATREEFLQHYDDIFTGQVLNALREDKLIYGDDIRLRTADPTRLLVFTRAEGAYRLQSIAYQE
jgi:hypothetical protein